MFRNTLKQRRKLNTFSVAIQLLGEDGLDFMFLLNLELMIKLVEPLLDSENEPMDTSFKAI